MTPAIVSYPFRYWSHTLLPLIYVLVVSTVCCCQIQPNHLDYLFIHYPIKDINEIRFFISIVHEFHRFFIPPFIFSLHFFPHSRMIASLIYIFVSFLVHFRSLQSHVVRRCRKNVWNGNRQANRITVCMSSEFYSTRWITWRYYTSK